MAINPFRASVIRKAPSKIFKGREKEKESLAKLAGSSGLSELQMDKKLKELGYKNDPSRRKKIMSKILGKDGKTKTGFSKTEKEGSLSEQQVRNIRGSRMSEIAAYEREKGGLGRFTRQSGEVKVKSLEVGSSEEDLGTVGYIAGDNIQNRRNIGSRYSNKDLINPLEQGLSGSPRVNKPPSSPINRPPKIPLSR
jgi:hypothetical protein